MPEENQEAAREALALLTQRWHGGDLDEATHLLADHFELCHTQQELEAAAWHVGQVIGCLLDFGVTLGTLWESAAPDASVPKFLRQVGAVLAAEE